MKNLLGFDYRKAVQAINYFAEKQGGEIDKLKAIKLIYFADRYHLRKYGRPIVNDEYWAMQKGPVASAVKDIAEFSIWLDETERQYASDFIAISGNDQGSLVSRQTTDRDFFSKTDIEALDFVNSNFGTFSAEALVDLAHQYPEWKKFEETLGSEDVKRMKMSYSDFFLDPTNLVDDKFAEPRDRLEAAKDSYDEALTISQVLSK